MLRHMKLLGLDQRGHGREVSYSILASSPNLSLTAINT
ncbi:Pimeloyl-ACP methyl ester carboxylesterase [Pseudomonas syringae pv. actinidiae]|uniref:Pimeloyl-ACP methyl ester carboxylesterase n=1 Tax=Pseudomonas syringae pv. actinidiae TaxID=103796 RepID=A0AAN4Q6X0_PSESF|nr:Pimeloyl-ACP methyl ester carboxylesterase [Pseudomonas syringae pv. actinidiae]